MRLDPLPASAAWQHIGTRSGFEVLFTSARTLEGHTTAVEQGEIWSVSYRIELDVLGRDEHAADPPCGLRRG